MNLVFSLWKLVKGRSYDFDFRECNYIHEFTLDNVFLQDYFRVIKFFNEVSIEDYDLAIRAAYHLVNIFQGLHQCFCKSLRILNFINNLQKLFIFETSAR